MSTLVKRRAPVAGAYVTDNTLSSESENAVQNKVIKTEFDAINSKLLDTNYYSNMVSSYFDIEASQYNKLEEIGYFKHLCCSVLLKKAVAVVGAVKIATFPEGFRGSGIGSGTVSNGNSVAIYANGDLQIVTPTELPIGTRIFIDIWYH